MNTIDIIYIIATAGALIGGFMTGFLSKVSSIVGIVFGIFNAIVLQESASKMLQDATELSETNATIIAFAALLIVSFIGTLMLMLPPPLPGSHLRLKEGFIITALGWITMSLCGALP